MAVEQKRRLLSRRTICFAIVIMTVFAASVVFTAVAAEKSGMYWAGMGQEDLSPKPEGRKGFIMVDVTEAWQSVPITEEALEGETVVIGLAIGPTPSIPTLTTEELKLYGILSKGDGFITDEDRKELNRDACWREVVLEKDDTIESVAATFGIPVADVRVANELEENQKLQTAEVLFIPNSIESVSQTLAYVRKLKMAEADLRRRAKPVETHIHIVERGETLWSIAARYDLELDSIIGSNKLSDVNRVNIETELRIPNQDGVFVKVGKRDTIPSLSKKYSVAKEAIYSANMLLESAEVAVGLELFLPGAKLHGRTAYRAAISAAATAPARIISAGGGIYRWPLAGDISSNFGWRRSPFGTRRVFHSGLDIRAPKGRGIVAAADGVVVHSGWMGGYGYTVVIEHADGSTTLYGHCSSLVAKRGENVKSGDLIARVGSTGRSTGNHLHFEVRIKGATQNPLDFLR